MKATAIEDLFLWSVYQADRRIDFNGFYWRRPSGGILFDPMPLREESAAWLRDQNGAVSWILLTNADHLRDALALREAFGARIIAPETDREALAGCADDWYGTASPLPEELLSNIEVRWLYGGKTPAEAVLILPALRAILFGDAVRSHESGVLRLLPDAKLEDRSRLVADLADLRQVDFDAVLLGDGDCLFTGARVAFVEFADRCSRPDSTSCPR
jgi:glyoxylase-like metal-dependent hydrolase (beta-lactamase superfamily II)